jgi:hypothetical protein
MRMVPVYTMKISMIMSSSFIKANLIDATSLESASMLLEALYK